MPFEAFINIMLADSDASVVQVVHTRIPGSNPTRGMAAWCFFVSCFSAATDLHVVDLSPVSSTTNSKYISSHSESRMQAETWIRTF